jgi:XXXCH domain-containing protein
MKKSEKKSTFAFDPEGFSRFLRQVADAVEGRPAMDTDPFINFLPEFETLSLKIRRRPEAFDVKAKVRLPRLDAASSNDLPSASGHEGGSDAKYRALKKRMKSDFKQIGEGLAAGRIPQAAPVRSFLRDSRLMIGFAGKGEAFYEAYRRACARFSHAFEASDMQAMASAYADLERLRNAAHRKYK